MNRLVRIDYPDTEDTVYTYGGANDAGGASNRILRVDDASGSCDAANGKNTEFLSNKRGDNSFITATQNEKTVNILFE